MDGTVLKVTGTPGAQVAGAAKTGFITLGDLTDLQVRAMFPLGEVDHLKIGQPSKITLAMQPDHTYTGTVTGIDPAATTSGTRALYGVMISLNDSPKGLLTGMSATTQVETARAEATAYIPPNAVHDLKSDTGTVLLRHSGRTTTRTVHRRKRRPLRRRSVRPDSRRPRPPVLRNHHRRLPRPDLPHHLTPRRPRGYGWGACRDVRT